MGFTDNMLSITSPGEMAQKISERLRQRRLDNNWSRQELARRSGVTVASIKRFELTAEISFKRLLQLCFVLHALNEFDTILAEHKPLTIAEIEKSLKRKQRQRGRTKKSSK